jgi:hypothetical protein
MDFACFIRRGHQWSRGRNHHRQALVSFVNTPVNNINEGVYISVPHEDGGQFVATFRHNRDFVDNNNVQYCANYVDEYGRNVEIMICNPNYVAFINRVTDIPG